jgi:diguanylate cyclase (GGDEF)-like protein
VRQSGEPQRHEAAILERLAGLPGVPRLIHPSDGGPPAVDDDGATPFAALPEPGVLAELAGVLAAVHDRGVIHKNLHPAVLGLAAGRPHLSGFEMATTFAEERPAFTHQSRIAGRLAYLAPEQTGRTGLPVDHRADLYALGASLYDLATGRPPFGDGTGDALQLVHDHLARRPVPPQERNPALRPDLAAIILRLLEKEPDRRYQSAQGLAHDLAQVAAGAPVRLGERDFAARLSPPSRLIGRDAEAGVLRRAFEDAIAGSARGLFVGGGPGVGKSALITELLPMVTAAGGWYVAGKFDQYRRDQASDATWQALRALGRLLLAEPDRRLDDLRPRLATRLGANATVVAAALPEFALLLGHRAAAVDLDDHEYATRLRQGFLDVLREVASAQRPVVLALDDLQWAGPFPVALVDAVLDDRDLAGVLVVGSYRDGGGRERWQPELHLTNLPPADVATLLAGMLRLDPEPAAALAGPVRARTGGNPFDTVELVNALRRDGVLHLGPAGWQWDDAAVRGHLGTGDVVALVTARIGALPEAARDRLAVMACLGGEVDPEVLGDPGPLGPAMEDGLVVRDAERGALRFRHDRVQQAAYAMVTAGERRRLHLRLARQLAAGERYAGLAAEQYLPVTGELTEPAERRLAAGLFRQAAAAVRGTDGAAAERFLEAALGLDCPDLTIGLLTDLHAARHGLGDREGADGLYADLAARCTDPLDLVDATAVQILSLTGRRLMREAIEVGEGLLARLGVTRPANLGATLAERLGALSAWAAATSGHPDRRPEDDDPYRAGVAKLLERLLSPAYFVDPALFAWIAVESHRRWVEHGPNLLLISGLGRAATVMIAVTQDYRGAYALGRHVLAIAEKRGYLFAAIRIRFVFAGFVQPWFEPCEDNLALLARCREEMIQSGDYQYASYVYQLALGYQMDVARTLDAVRSEVEVGAAFAERTGNTLATVTYGAFGRLIGGLQDGPGAGSAGPAAAPVALDELHGNAVDAMLAMIYNDDAGMDRASAVALGALESGPGTWVTLYVHLTRCLALARAGRAGTDEYARPAGWLTGRAQDSPGNFGHLADLLRAEEAWAAGEPLAALQSFDAALAAMEGRDRVWQTALIRERAGRIHLELGLVHSGQSLLARAHEEYAGWGAAGKAASMAREHQFLRDRVAGPAGPGADLADTIDLMAVLEASRVLSSETSVARLRERVVEVAGAMTGATGVQLVLAGADGWAVSTPAGDVPIEDPGTGPVRGGEQNPNPSATLLPVSAFRFAERTGEPLLVADAVRDGRFTTDPYLAGADVCALLIMPVLVQGAPRAMLVLENKLSRGAFRADRLDALRLIAGQLAVSLDNALLYAAMERKVAERTAELASANARLDRLSRTDALTGCANRREFDERLAHEWKRAARTGAELTVVMLDVDEFKLYNDRYGHPGGDACLRTVVAAVQRAMRDTDLVARYGGEEFAVILPGPQPETGTVVAERIRAAVEDLALPHAATGRGILTVSLGVASVAPATGGEPGKLVEAADAALYEAKRAGRNCVRS